MPGEDEADLVAMVVDGIEQGACPTAGDAKDVIDPRLNKHFAHLLAGLHGGLLCAKNACMVYRRYRSVELSASPIIGAGRDQAQSLCLLAAHQEIAILVHRRLITRMH